MNLTQSISFLRSIGYSVRPLKGKKNKHLVFRGPDFAGDSAWSTRADSAGLKDFAASLVVSQ